jgi:putative glutamine amidotransferase
MAPLIGITSYSDHRQRGAYAALNENYSRSVRAAGGMPLVIPVSADFGAGEAAALLDRLDGILFSGGADLSPLSYGEEPLPQVNAWSSDRDAQELALCREAVARGLPVFGICRGQQLVNVALGGSLVQDIPAQVGKEIGHAPTTEAMDELRHSIEVLAPESLIAPLFDGPRGVVNSFHHQSVKELGKGLRATARAPDGVVEAIEGSGLPGWLHCVQFHPEALTQRWPAFLRLFRDHVEAAAAYARGGA